MNGEHKNGIGLPGGAIAVTASTPGNIENISMGGISVVYLHYCDTLHPPGETLDILDGQNNFFMENIPCRLVSKKKLANETPFSMLRMMQCSFAFGELTDSERAELESYIEHHSDVRQILL